MPVHGRSPRGGPGRPGISALAGRFRRSATAGLSRQGRSLRGAPPVGFAAPPASLGGPVDPSDGCYVARLPSPAALSRHPPPRRTPDRSEDGFPLQGRSPDGLPTQGFLCARGPVGLVCHGRSLGPRGAGVSCPGLRSRRRWTGSIGRLPRPRALCRLPTGSLFPRPIAAGACPATADCHREVERVVCRASLPRGFDATWPGLSRSRCVAGSFSDHARSGRFFFLNRSRGSLCVPPGRQSLPRRSAAGGRIALRLPRCGCRVPLHLKNRPARLRATPTVFPARKPLHGDIGVLALQLHERRLQLLALPRAESRRRAVDQDRPVGMAGRHPAILTGSWRWACYYPTPPRRKVMDWETSLAKIPLLLRRVWSRSRSCAEPGRGPRKAMAARTSTTSASASAR